MDADQAALDARVAEAAEAWLTDPAHVAAYARLVAAVEQRRRWLHRAGSPGSAADWATDSATDSATDWTTDSATDSETVPRSTGSDGRPESLGDSAKPADEASDDDLNRSWPTVRAVGADLVGDPAAVLRRLRGG